MYDSLGFLVSCRRNIWPYLNFRENQAVTLPFLGLLRSELDILLLLFLLFVQQTGILSMTC